MTILPYLAFALVIVALVCAHFMPAYRAWSNSRIPTSSDIDTRYVRVEDYFARSFRAKVAEWIQLPPYAAMPDGSTLVKKGRERLRITNSCEFPPQSQSDDVLIVRGPFTCGTRCVFHREIFAAGNVSIGETSWLQSIAADGNLTLGDGARITRWVDSAGELRIGAGAIVGVKATAGRMIRLQKGARVKSAFAPTVSTVPDGAEVTPATASSAQPEWEIPPGGGPLPGTNSLPNQGSISGT